MQRNKILIFVPTYNESDNIKKMIPALRELGLSADLLFLDDNSPDGTGQILDQFAKNDPGMYVIHRSGKNGIGSAHKDGINYAYDHGYETLVTLDCDFTHDPKAIPQLLAQLDLGHHDIVVGSRFMQEKSLVDWNPYRKLMTALGHFLTANCLAMPYDATGAFRAYNIKNIQRDFLRKVGSNSYSFFFESLFILNINKLRIKEVPVVLSARTLGQSKMQFKDISNSVGFLGRLMMLRLLDIERFYFNKGQLQVAENTALKDLQSWDDYWGSKSSTSSFIYDLIAAFYRKYIIRRNLNFFLKRHFGKNALLLHAGCGSGQVDTEVHDHFTVEPLDISVSALKFYGQVNPNAPRLIHGSIFDVPSDAKRFDGIYNLGVMEHFELSDIDKALKEFGRVLKDDGKLVLFWPPEYGLSVIFLKIVHYVMNDILKKNVKFHPDEISRIQSRAQAKHILEKNGFQVVEYYFGIRDFFTYAIVVAKKSGAKSKSVRKDGVSLRQTEANTTA